MIFERFLIDLRIAQIGGLNRHVGLLRSSLLHLKGIHVKSDLLFFEECPFPEKT